MVNHWRGRPSMRLHESRLLGLWAGFREVRLTTYYRSASRWFAGWLMQARLLGRREEALRMFPATDRQADWTLCLSNFRRQQVNVARQLLEAEERGAVCHMRLEGREVPVFVGTRLAVASQHGRWVNGALLEFQGEVSRAHQGGKPHFGLRDLDLGTVMVASQKQIERRCRLGWALTIAGCQSKTLEGVVRVCDLLSPHFNATHLYVAASRVKDPALLECLP